jgi:hypothetical protein
MGAARHLQRLGSLQRNIITRFSAAFSKKMTYSPFLRRVTFSALSASIHGEWLLTGFALNDPNPTVSTDSKWSQAWSGEGTNFLHRRRREDADFVRSGIAYIKFA